MGGRGDGQAGILRGARLGLNLGRWLRVWGLGRQRIIDAEQLLVMRWLLWNRRVECWGGSMDGNMDGGGRMGRERD